MALNVSVTVGAREQHNTQYTVYITSLFTSQEEFGVLMCIINSLLLIMEYVS